MPVPHVPQPTESWGTEARSTQGLETKGFQKAVPLVPHVPLENNEGWDEEDWQAAYDERAAILEYDEGLPRAEAERLAAEQIAQSRSLNRKG